MDRKVWYLDVLFTLFILHDHKDRMFVIFALEISMNLWQKRPSVCCSLTISLWNDRLPRKEKSLQALDLIRLEKINLIKIKSCWNFKTIYDRVDSFCGFGYKVSFVLHGDVQKSKALKGNSVNSHARHMFGWSFCKGQNKVWQVS